MLLSQIILHLPSPTESERLFFTSVSLESEEKVKVTQSYPTLFDPMDYTVHGILQARIL